MRGRVGRTPAPGFTLVAGRPHRSYGVTLTGQDWRPPLPEPEHSPR